jgi:hypothetical protein
MEIDRGAEWSAAKRGKFSSTVIGYLFSEFRREAVGSNEDNVFLIEVSEFRVTRPKPCDHANSGIAQRVLRFAGPSARICTQRTGQGERRVP